MIDIADARARLRRAAIRRALYTVYPRPLGLGLIADALPADLTPVGDELPRAIYYLTDRRHVVEHGHPHSEPRLYRLTADGVDKVESSQDQSLDLARAARMLRLRVLQALSWGGPAPMGPSLISVALAEDADLDLSEPSIRRALAYLEERELVAVASEGMWRITADGMDYLAGDGAGIAGVARPTGW